MVCIDTEQVRMGKKILIQVCKELLLPYRNASIISEEEKSKFVEVGI